MSADDVAWVREAVDAINRGEFDLPLDRTHPEVEWRTLDAFPDAQTYRGPAAVREFFTTWHDTFRGFRLHLDRCAPIGDDHVLAAMRVSGEGAGSGVEVESPAFFQLLEFRGGQLIRARMFQTESEALQAAPHG
jgi:hypothetical protein